MQAYPEGGIGFNYAEVASSFSRLAFCHHVLASAEWRIIHHSSVCPQN